MEEKQTSCLSDLTEESRGCNFFLTYDNQQIKVTHKFTLLLVCCSPEDPITTILDHNLEIVHRTRETKFYSKLFKLFGYFDTDEKWKVSQK